jgi:hypothetical protein
MIKLIYKDNNKQNPKDVFRLLSFITYPIANGGTVTCAVVARFFDNKKGQYVRTQNGNDSKFIEVTKSAGDIETIPINQLKVVDSSKEDDLTNDRKKYLRELYLLLNNEELIV